jgi:hypothetical protein
VQCVLAVLFVYGKIARSVFRALQIGRVLSMYNAPRSKKEKYIPGGPVCTTRRDMNQGPALPPVVVLGNAT